MTYCTLSLAVLMAAACVEDAPTPTAAAPDARALHGETLFRGVFFGEGEVGARLPELRSSAYAAPPPEHAARVAEVRRELVARIRAADPAFFDRFASAVTSGRHVQIERVMDDARELLRAAVGDAGATASVESPDEQIVIYLGPLLYYVNYTDIYVYYVIEPETSIASAATGLRRDAVVDLLARRLGTPNGGRA